MDLHTISQFLIHTAQAATEAAPHAAELAAQAAPEAHVESKSVLETLGIDWRIFIAQLINFGVILFVLWKWVLTPVARKLTERTEKIEKSLNDAERIEKEKQEFSVWRDSEMAKVRNQAASLVAEAETQATQSKQQILLQAKEEQAKVVEQAKSQIEQEKQKALQAAKSELADIVTTATEKILREKIDEKKDKELIKEFLGQAK